MEKYIITFEDGSHHIADKVTNTDKAYLCDGVITVIRLSDGSQLDANDNWIKLPNWVG